MKFRFKEVVLLSVPVLFLLGLAYTLQRPAGDGSLNLVKSSVKTLPGSAQTTIVDVVVKYNSPSRLPAFIQGDNLRYSKSWLVDKRGLPLQSRHEEGIGVGSGPFGQNLYRETVQLSLAGVPQSLRPLTMKFEIAMGDKVLPVSVKVP